MAGSLLDYYYGKHHYKTRIIDLSKQESPLDADPKPIRQINFTGKLKENA